MAARAHPSTNWAHTEQLGVLGLSDTLLWSLCIFHALKILIAQARIYYMICAFPPYPAIARAGLGWALQPGRRATDTQPHTGTCPFPPLIQFVFFESNPLMCASEYRTPRSTSRVNTCTRCRVYTCDLTIPHSTPTGSFRYQHIHQQDR